MNRILNILLYSSFFLIFSIGLLGPIYAIFVEDIGGDVLTAGSTYAVYSIVMGIVIFLLSKWEDHVKHQEKLLVASRVLTVVGTAGYLFVSSPTDLFLVQVIIGISYAIGAPVYDTMYSKHLERGKGVSQWGVWESMDAIVTGISAFLGSLIVALFGFHILMIVMLVFSFLSLGVSLLLFKHIRVHIHEKRIASLA